MAIPKKPNERNFDGPIPGQSLTAEIGSRPWQQPPQFSTIEEAIDYYIPRLQSEEVTEQLLDVLEMGIPVTTIANTMQLASVMEGKHSVDVGILVLPVLIELIMLIADTAGIEYTTGIEKPKRIRNTLVNKAVEQFKNEEAVEETTENAVMVEPVENQQMDTGLMSRRV
jgi:hypothetical protein